MTTFWLLLTIACLLWYASVTAYVAVRGVFDIRGMLERLARSTRGEPGGEPDSRKRDPLKGGAGGTR